MKAADFTGLKAADLKSLWDALMRDVDKPTVIPMSKEGFAWAKKQAKRLGLVPIKNPRIGGPVFRKKRKTDK